MIAAVADTHAAVWYLFGDSRLSAPAREAFDKAAAVGRQIAISAITLAELIYLVEKQRIQPEVLETLSKLLREESILVVAPFDRTVAWAMREVPRSQIPDLPDRIIAATALALEVPLISRDRKIQASEIATVW